jgi:hypothetical protein
MVYRYQGKKPGPKKGKPQANKNKIPVPQGCHQAQTCGMAHYYWLRNRDKRLKGLTDFEWTVIQLILAEVTFPDMIRYAKYLRIPAKNIMRTISDMLHRTGGPTIGKYAYLFALGNPVPRADSVIINAMPQMNIVNPL